MPDITTQDPSEVFPEIHIDEAPAPEVVTEETKEPATPETVAEPSEEEKAKEEEERHRKSGVKRLKEQLAAARAEAEALRKQVPQQQTRTDDPEPNVFDFGDWDAFDKARMEWVERQAEKRVQQRHEEARKKAEQDRQVQETTERFQRAFQTYPDLQGLINKAQAEGLEPSQAMIEAFMDAEDMGGVLRELLLQPDEFDRLKGLSPVKVVKEIARIEDRLATGKKTESPKPVTSAKPPIKPLSPGTASIQDRRAEEYPEI